VKKVIAFLLMLSILIASFTGMVWAEEPAPTEQVTAAGFYTIGSATGMTITAKTSAGAVITSTSANVDGQTGYETFYPNSEKLAVQVTGTTSGKQYLVLLVTGDSLPDSASKICYINQIEATGTTVDFNVYPMLPESETSTTTAMKLYVTSNDGSATKEATLNYVTSGTYDVAPYKLGDVDGDNKVTPSDALDVLRHYVKLQLLDSVSQRAADVDKDGKVTPSDALDILRYYVKLINEF